MSSWGKADAAASAPLWALMQLATEQTDGNRTTLFEDTTADAFVSGQTIGYSTMQMAKSQTELLMQVGT